MLATFLLACASAPPDPPAVVPEWWPTVEASLEADARAFRGDAGGFGATVRDVHARIDAHGLATSGASGEVRLRFVGYGRHARADAAPVAPVAGACTAERDPTGACIPRVELRRPELTEWWHTRSNGFEQGWTVAARPSGAGDLHLVVEAEGATVSGGGWFVTLLDATGGGWTYSDPKAVDADGRRLPARLALRDGRIDVVVDDEGARYPIEVDPVFAAGRKRGQIHVAGVELPIGFGAGDFNGDGYTDVVVGTDQNDIRTFEGSATGIESTADRVVAVLASDLAVGEFTGDTRADVVVFTGGTDPWIRRFDGTSGGLSTTAVVVAAPNTAGTPDWLTDVDVMSPIGGDWNGNGKADVFLAGSFSGGARGLVLFEDSLGFGVYPVYTALTDFVASPAGDLDGNGIADFMLAQSSAHATEIWHGYGIQSLPLVYTYDDVGSAFAGAIGDTNGDGYGEVSVALNQFIPPQTQIIDGNGVHDFDGAYGHATGCDFDADGYSDGVWGGFGATVTVVRGDPAGLDVSTPVVIGSGGSLFGTDVQCGGDIDADGYADLLVSDLTNDVLYIYYGSAMGIVPTGITIQGASVGELGAAVTGAGDINADGFDDVAVGAPRVNGAGAVYVYKGSATGLGTTATAITPPGGATGTRFGVSVAGIGDFNRDGRDDLLIGADNANAGKGAAYVVFGASGALAPNCTFNGQAVDDEFGHAVGGADVDDDGDADAIIGAPGASSDNGRFYVYLGRTGNCPTSPDDSVNGGTGFRLGEAIAGAGDVNGLGGNEDVVVGGPGYSSNTGRAFVFHGDGTGVGATAARILTGQATGDRFGSAVAGAGDVNGDGYGDIVVGAYSHADGRAYVYHGSSTGIPSAAATTIDAPSGSFGFGRAVAGAGDSNVDGFDEIVVGAPFATYGTAYVFDGRSTGVSTTPGTTMLGAWSSGQFGVSVDGAGDVNGDGNADVIVGEPFAGNSLGLFQIHYGYIEDADGDGAHRDVDCDDTNANRRPGLVETIGDNVDNNCDGENDCWGDGDLDGERNSSVVHSPDADCTDAGEARTVAQIDCNDADPAINHGATEIVGDAVDQNCNGKETCWADNDNDGYRTGVTKSSGDVDCDDDQEALTVEPSGDCNDNLPEINPGATEVPGNGTDQNCDTDELCYADNDDDFYRTAATLVSDDLLCDGLHEAWASDPSGDCDDTAGTGASVYPTKPNVAGDVPDTRDNDCDGFVECFQDLDNDDYGTGTILDTGTTACSAAANRSLLANDCDDNASTGAGAYPTKPNVAADVADTRDNDCDGAVECFQDLDNDEYGTATIVDSGTTACGAAANNRSLLANDCDDNASTGAGAYPTKPNVAADVADTRDNDCDGFVECFEDLDNDEYGTAKIVDIGATDCGAAANRSLVASDCDDNASTGAGAYPTKPNVAADVADTRDNDCDGAVECFEDLDNDEYGTGTIVDAGATACGAAVKRSLVANDCDDNASTGAGVYPSKPNVAADVADTRDNDCDGFVECFQDLDNDDYGTATILDTGTTACVGAANRSLLSTDCNDAAAGVNPGATEVCAAGDEDCDQLADDADPSVTGRSTWYADADGDGQGDAAVSALACIAPGAHVAGSTDCDDADPATYLGALELPGDGIDEDCDDGEVCFADADDDGWRPDATTTEVSGDPDCDDPAEAADTDPIDDCDDADPLFHPDAPEDDCQDPNDYNCDGSVGFADTDIDGWAACDDCDDLDADIHPGAVEIEGDGVDSDCDGAEDCFADGDGDGARTGDAIASIDADCADPGEALATAPFDCDDFAADAYPGRPLGASDVADAADNDCDGFAECFVDGDTDGFGSTAVVSDSATCDASHSLLATDCADGDSLVYPGATEVPGDAVDQDCDGAEVCFVDADGDGYRPDASTVPSADIDCSGLGEAAAGDPAGDCADDDPARNPGAPEVDCTDPIDYDCDGSTPLYADNDGDGSPVCEDCDDTDGEVHPGAEELPGDGVDSDCDGADVCFVNADGDGYRTDVTALGTLGCSGAGEADQGMPAGDCDDADAAVHPGAAEGVGDGVDGDCDGGELCDADLDADGWTSSTVASVNLDCGDAGEAVAPSASDDCNDGNPAVNPGMTEVIDDGADGDCDGSELCFADADNDGYRPDDFTTVASPDADCDSTGEGDGLDPSGDCADSDAAIHPGVAEVCDGVDQDCDGVADSGDPAGDIPDGVVIPGAAGDHLGFAVQVADLDGDGLGDLVVGAPDADLGGTSSGAVYVFFGPVASLDALDADVTLVGAPGDRVGLAVVAADLDGLPGLDLAIGGAGVVYVAGTQAGTIDLATDAAVLVGVPGFGRSLAAVGDMDGDGEEDLAVGVAQASQAWLFLGPITSGQPAAVRFDGNAGSLFGRALAGADLDGDGLADLAVGAPADDAVALNAGAAYLFRGDAALAFGGIVVGIADADAVWTGLRRDRAGGALASAGDRDQDGQDELWIAGKREGSDNAGAVWGVGLGSGSLDTVAWARLDGPGPDQRAGTSLADADVDGDGVSDLVIGGRIATGETAQSGAAWVVYGPISGVIDLGAADVWLRGDVDLGQFGRSVSAGDIDGDGAADVLVGGWASGGAWLYLGGTCP